MTDVVIGFNRISQAKAAIAKEVAATTVRAAEDLRDVLARALDEGLLIQSDTHALAKSLYVKATNGRDDYAPALAAARAAFESNPSAYRSSPASEKAAANFEKLIAHPEPLPVEPNVFVAAVATMLAYGNVWEFERPWMSPVMWEWANTRLAGFYQSLQIKA